MDTDPIKVIWLTDGRHLPDSDLVVTDFHVARNGEASGLTITVIAATTMATEKGRWHLLGRSAANSARQSR